MAIRLILVLFPSKQPAHVWRLPCHHQPNPQTFRLDRLPQAQQGHSWHKIRQKLALPPPPMHRHTRPSPLENHCSLCLHLLQLVLGQGTLPSAHPATYASLQLRHWRLCIHARNTDPPQFRRQFEDFLQNLAGPVSDRVEILLRARAAVKRTAEMVRLGNWSELTYNLLGTNIVRT